MYRFLLTTVLLTVALGGTASRSWAQPGMDKDPLSFDRQIGPMLRRYCYRCHNGDEASGDVNLQQDENPNLILKHRKTWETALEMIRSSQMPPDDARKMKEGDRERVIAYLTKKLSEFDCDSLSDPGTPTARRLTRHEYNLAVRDLVGIDLRPGDDFAPDPTGYGFYGVGDAMGLSPVQVEQYDRAARSVVEAIVAMEAKNSPAFAALFGADDDPPVAAVRPKIRRFASRAFRRPLDDSMLDRYLAVYELARDQQHSHVDALAHVYRAVMMSPRFFMRIETPRPDTVAEKPYAVDGFDLATRLSFFLWSSPPDQVLRELAAAGALSDEQTLVAQTRRMLTDPRVEEGLVQSFFYQWLQLGALKTHQVDAKAFPDFDEALRQSMQGEVAATLANLVREDRPLTDLVDADFAFVDERLARHYQIESVSGDTFRQVALSDRRRGGLLTSAAMLMLQSDPGRTNVPRRGNYVAGTFLGAPPPPPPPDVPALEEVVDDGKVRTLRQLLEEHRKRPQCASCHAKMDPIGFALENFDAIGRWRTKDAGLPIDASGRLPGGESFDGPVGLKEVLLARRKDLARALAEKLMIYALGRGLRDGDECTIRDALAASAEHEDKFSALVIEIVKSFPFRHRMDPQF